MRRIILPLVLALAFYSESLFAAFFPPEAFGAERLFIPHFVASLLIFMGIYHFGHRALVYAAIFGLIYDVYYTGIIGVYLFMFPIAVYFAMKLMKVWHTNLLTSGLAAILSLALMESLVYGFQLLVMHVSVTPADFATDRLLPTLILNLAFIILVSFPFSRFLMRRKKEEAES
ncbi:MAG TPA: rod shape-determining protein MreD [Bacillaceae bacterium]